MSIQTTPAPDKGGFAHFMLKEIHEQPDVLRNALAGRLDVAAGTALLDTAALPEPENIITLGHGTSLYAGMVARLAFEELAGIRTTNELSADFRDRQPALGKRDWVVGVSQSGETTDTVGAAREAAAKGAALLSVCNVPTSTLSRMAAAAFDLRAGPEISIASTKAFTSQIAILCLLALKVGRTRGLSAEAATTFATALATTPQLAAKVLTQAQAVAAIAERYFNYDDIYFIGRGPLYPVALEGALKLKETAYVHSEGYHSAEVKHGPFALLDKNMPVVALACDIPGKQATLDVATECRERGARVLGIVTEGDTAAAACFDDAIAIPATVPLLTPLPAVVILQLFAYNIARLRGRDVDKPRNLTKAVLVK